MEIIGGLIAGGFIGAVLGFIGAGGAMLSVPILLYIFGFTPQAATTAAIAVVLTAAISGLLPKIKSKEVLFKEAAVIWALGLVTNLGFSLIAHRISDSVLTTGFSLVLFTAGTAMLIKPVAGTEKKIPIFWLVVMSLVIGSMTGLFGIGGGFLAVPVLVLFFNVPQGKAAGTSLAIIAINSITAFFGHYQSWSDVTWTVPIAMSIAAVIVARIASIKSGQMNQAILRKTFAGLLYSVAIFTLLQTWVIA
ncbi:MAG: sulfite exporter TauE/SafE family protein [Candidatus Planktophila sp.]